MLKPVLVSGMRTSLADFTVHDRAEVHERQERQDRPEDELPCELELALLLRLLRARRHRDRGYRRVSLKLLLI